jgi:multidrug efflux pump subunit AcrB
VDVPVVASDGINRELHKGESRLRAAWLGPRHLRHPMVFGTLINIFAFLPLLLLSGDKGEFMKCLPIVIMISLLAALLVSFTFTPLIGGFEAQQQLFPAENALSRIEASRRLTVVQLYKALGGGWSLKESDCSHKR